MAEVYKGVIPSYMRATGMLTWYFCSVDNLRRKTNLWNSTPGTFIASGGSAMTGFWLIWPFEVLKNLAQADHEQATTSTL